jgi:hypothetical protein
MWVDPEAEIRARMRDRVREAERQRLAARSGEPGRGGRRLAGYRWRLRQVAGFGLMRTGLSPVMRPPVWRLPGLTLGSMIGQASSPLQRRIVAARPEGKADGTP